MIYFTSDLHLGHTNVLKLCNRPFQTVEEMDVTLIKNWNKRITNRDTVYVVGDIVWDKKKLALYMEQLNGKKVLIIGNHDREWSRREESKNYFTDILPYLEMNMDGHPITLCHYPMLEWNGSREHIRKRVGYHIHGHIHNRVSDKYNVLYTQYNALNAGVDINGYVPVTLEELLENNLSFKLSALENEEDKKNLIAAYDIIPLE